MPWTRCGDSTEDMRRMMGRVDARSGCPGGHAAASCIRHGGPPGVADSGAQVCAATGQTSDPWRILGCVEVTSTSFIRVGVALHYPALHHTTLWFFMRFYEHVWATSTFSEPRSIATLKDPWQWSGSPAGTQPRRISVHAGATYESYGPSLPRGNPSVPDIDDLFIRSYSQGECEGPCGPPDRVGLVLEPSRQIQLSCWIGKLRTRCWVATSTKKTWIISSNIIIIIISSNESWLAHHENPRNHKKATESRGLAGGRNLARILGGVWLHIPRRESQRPQTGHGETNHSTHQVLLTVARYRYGYYWSG